MKKVDFPFSLFAVAVKSARHAAPAWRLPRDVVRGFSRLGGVSLMETIMAVAVGGVVASAGTVALTRYAEGSRVDSAAEQMVSYAAATELWLTDNYDALRGVSAGSSATRVSATVLEPYLGAPVRTDAFRHTYEIAVRRYNYTTPKAGGGVTTRTAVQAALLARGGDGTLVQKPEMRARIAAKAGAPVGYVATGSVSCDNPATGAPLAAGALCGSFGAYAVNNAALPAAERFPAAALKGATLVAMSTVGDTAMEGASAAEEIPAGGVITAAEEVITGFGLHKVAIPEICLKPDVEVDLVFPNETSARVSDRLALTYRVPEITKIQKTFYADGSGGEYSSGNGRSWTEYWDTLKLVQRDIEAIWRPVRVGDEWRVNVTYDPAMLTGKFNVRPWPAARYYEAHIGTYDMPYFPAGAPLPHTGSKNVIRLIAEGGSRFWMISTSDGLDYGGSNKKNIKPLNFLKDINFYRLPAAETVRRRVQVRCSRPK